MSETRVPRGTQVRLENVPGDLRVEKNARIEVDGKIVVIGAVRFEGVAEVRGDLECRSFESDGGTVRVRGSLLSAGEVRSRDGSIEVEGEFRATRADVDRGLTVNGPAFAERFEVGGLLEGKSSLTATRVWVGVKFHLVG